MEKEKIRLSIIIPVYNVENYIAKCLDSVLAQKLEKYEIIIVDDGSTDDSLRICLTYKEKNNNIKIIHQENRGLSGARNTGIENAQGEFIMFVDSDDFIIEQADLRNIVNKLEKDVTVFKWVYYYSNNDKLLFFKNFKNNYEEDINKKLLFLTESGDFPVYAWNKIIKKELIEKNRLRFNEEIVSEDIDWSLSVLNVAHNMECYNNDVYAYRQAREGSITKKINNKTIKSILYSIDKWFNYNYKNETKKKAFYNILSYHYINLFTVMDKNNSTELEFKKMKKYYNLIEKSTNPKVKKCRLFFKLFGYNISKFIFRSYIKLKDKGIVKL